MKWRLLILFSVVLSTLAGCGGEQAYFNEIKHPHEILKISEINNYLKIVNQLPDHQLPELPPLFAELPRWDLNRELSVKGLVKEEQKHNLNRWFSEAVLVRLSANRPLEKLLKKHDLSLKQFLGLTETICMAAARSHFADISELRDTMRNGHHEISQLLKHEEVFSSLPEAEQYELIRQGAWITRVARAQELLRVPDENVELIKKHFELLKPFLHPDCLTHPLQGIVDNVNHHGLPFDENEESGFDSQLKWSPDDPNAIIGHATEKQLASAADRLR